MTGTAILAAFRTPVAPRGTAFADLEIYDLAAPVIRACLDHAGIDADAIDDVICANALGAGGNPARLIAQASGLSSRVAGLSIDRQCAGGLDAILLGRAMIETGQARYVLAGGAESYSRRPLRARGTVAAPDFYDRPSFAAPGHADPDLTAAAAALASTEVLSRAAMDTFAMRSHAHARAANFIQEIVPLAGISRDLFTRELNETLAARAPRLSGDITAATAAVAADAAAFVLLGRADEAPRAPVIVGGCTRGGSSADPALAPLIAIRETLSEAGVATRDVAVWEIMEAYAPQAMATMARLELDPSRVNRGGGALARGHPIGASGAINAVRLVHELRGSLGTGIAAIAAAGGIGTALMIRR